MAALLLTACVTGCGAPSEPSPDDVKIGTAYTYEMYTHCGAREAKFAGQYWETAQTDQRQTNSPHGWDDPYQKGTITRSSETSAVFKAEGKEEHYQLRPDATTFLRLCS